MKKNQNTVDVNILKSLETDIYLLLNKPEVWNTLDVDYYPPRVERLWTVYNGYRIFLHKIHKTDSACLYHKHRWPAAFKQLSGAYEMGITYSENEISTEQAAALPTLAKFIINAGSYYEMTQTDCLHYVKPLTDYSCSIMVTFDLYPEADFRKEVLDIKLNPLALKAKHDLILEFKDLMIQDIDVDKNVLLTIDRVRFVDKWVEFWFKEKPNESAYQLSSKSQYLWNAIEKAGIYDQVISEGLKDRLIVFELIGSNYEIKMIY